MAIARGWGAVLPLVIALGACGDGSGPADIGTLWGSESKAVRKAREEFEARKTNKVPMRIVRAVEIGRTKTGILLTAFGTAPGSGYSLPALRVRREGKTTSDGFLEFDLVASSPPPGAELPPATPRNLEIRADLPVDLRALRGVKGLRVMALENQVQVNF